MMRVDLGRSGQREIAAKAYLSRKDIAELVLPEHVDKIGNWAFAHMKNMKRLIVPKRQILLGKEVFKGCDSLEQVMIQDYGKAECEVLPDAGYLLAAALVKLDGQRLFLPEQAGSREWMQDFDKLLQDFIHDEDESGFRPMWFGGEEDYDDNDTNVERYREERRQDKVKLLILRLCYDAELTEENKKEFSGFLRELLLLPVFPAALWNTAVQCCQTNSKGIRILTESGCITLENETMVLHAMEEFLPEGRAVLLKWCAEHLGKEDFFGKMEL